MTTDVIDESVPVELVPATFDVLAIMVVHDGREWVERALEALFAQTYRHLQIVVIDNGSTDGSRDVLLDMIDPDDLLVSERDLGFAGAVAMALDSVANPPDWVVMVHDDLLLAPDAIEIMAAHVAADPRLACVGPKLVALDDPSRLSEVGMTVDITGRADSGIEPDELDQGQRDIAHPVLYVSTAGMMVRRDAFDEVGRFDRRYHLFRDDLDLCWRLWLAGHDVEVVPTASGQHAAGAANYNRLGQTAFLGPRYFAERNTLATLIKNYSARRLLWLLPLYFVVGVAKIVGFVATRRLSDAWQTSRAWAWNVMHVRGTLSRRRAFRQHRRRTDAEIAPLFARTASRVRAYFEAIGSWLAGGDDTLALEDPEPTGGEPQTATQRVVAGVRRQPILAAGLLLLVLGLAAAYPLLAPGTLRGGEIAPWPETPSAFWRGYAAAWNTAGGGGTGVPTSPLQALLGLGSMLALGSSWVASRFTLLAPLPVAWLLTIVSLRSLTPRRLPRLAAASAFVLSPPAILALTTGRLSALVTAAAMPAMLGSLAVVVRVGVPAEAAWRGTAAAALVGAVAVAFDPPVLVLIGATLVVLLIGVASSNRDSSDAGLVIVRLAAVAVSLLLVLFPWTLTLFTDRSPVIGGYDTAPSVVEPMWRWLVLAPEATGVLSVIIGIGLLAGGLLGVALGLANRPVGVPALWTVALLSTTLAWLTGRSAEPWIWHGTLLLIAAGALAALLAIGLDSAEEQLGQHDFGWRQLFAAVTGLVVVAGIGSSFVGLLGHDYGAFVVEQEPLPAFIASEQASVGSFRVLVVTDIDGRIAWDVTGPSGPSMREHGVAQAPELVDTLGSRLAGVMRGTDTSAAARFGLANIRYVVVPEGGRSPALERRLDAQTHLLPRPISEGLLYRVEGWLPQAAWLSQTTAAATVERGELPPNPNILGLEETAATTYVGTVEGPGVIALAQPAVSGWTATLNGETIQGYSENGLTRFVISEAGNVEVTYARQARRSWLLGGQVVIVLIVLSLMLRPPSFAVRRRRSA